MTAKSMVSRFLSAVLILSATLLLSGCTWARQAADAFYGGLGKLVVGEPQEAEAVSEERYAYQQLKPEEQTVYNQIVDITKLANITYIRQHEPKGLGHAILCAKTFVGDEPFAVLYGDDVILGENPVCKQLCDAYDQYEKGIVGIKEVTVEQIQKYSSMKLSSLGGNRYEITDMIEKPKPDQIFSLFSVLGRCVLPPRIFSILESIPYGYGGELQLTDAMKVLAQEEGMIGVDFDGRRYDMGNKLGVLEAIVEVGLTHPETGEGFRKYLKTIVDRL